ncbi:hypothetical protein D9M71_519160 [compost metagenome]
MIVLEPDIEEWLVGALVGHAPGFDQPGGEHLIVRPRGGLFLVIGEQGRSDLAAVELADPGFAGVAAVQHHTVVPHRPALGRTGEMHGDQIRADRDLSLLPVPASIIGIHNVPALAHRNQALPGPGQPGEHRPGSQFTRLCRGVEHIGKPAGDHRADKWHGQGSRQRRKQKPLDHRHYCYLECTPPRPCGSEPARDEANTFNAEVDCQTDSRAGSLPQRESVCQRMPVPARDSGAHWALESGSMYLIPP